MIHDERFICIHAAVPGRVDALYILCDCALFHGWRRLFLCLRDASYDDLVISGWLSYFR